MTDNKPAQDDIDLRINNLISSSQDRLFEYFDDLHKRGINDDDVIRSLRRNGYSDLAEGYIEWSGALDPDIQDDITAMSEAVPDPTDAPSYKGHPLNQRPAGITTVEQLAQLDDETVVVLKGGKAAQIVRDGTLHTLSIVGWDGWLHIMEPDDDWNWEIVRAEGRREIAAFLPATVLGVVR